MLVSSVADAGFHGQTLRKWWRWYPEQSEAGLQSPSRQPKTSPARKVSAEHEQWILQLRQERRLGVRHTQRELQRLHNPQLSLATIQKVLQRRGEKPLRPKRRQNRYKPYSKAMPGERVQMDTIKLR